ncbi:hypothetical protein KY332_04025 [Candidatus Woesearchaeota archaeon]|nr:hypothetical protein [Candidatus Woesearchaeota archaeon]
MTPIELAEQIERDFNSWVAEIDKEEKSISQIFTLEDKIAKAEEYLNHSLPETRENFDSLLNLLDRERVYVPEGKELTPESYSKAKPLVKSIYKEASKTISITKDKDLIEKPEIQGLNEYDANKLISLKSLKTIVKARFLLAELYTALGIRLDPALKSRSASAEYRKVIEEGEELYERLEQVDNAKILKIRLAHDIGAAYKRRYDLFFDSDKKIDSDRYGIIETETNPNKTKPTMHDDVKNSRKWYWKMFDATQQNPGEFNSSEIFSTEYEFRRYSADVEDLKVGCVFQKLESSKFLCSKQELTCTDREGSTCYHLRRNKKEYDSVLERAKEMTTQKSPI